MMVDQIIIREISVKISKTNNPIITQKIITTEGIVITEDHIQADLETIITVIITQDKIIFTLKLI